MRMASIREEEGKAGYRPKPGAQQLARTEPIRAGGRSGDGSGVSSVDHGQDCRR